MPGYEVYSMLERINIHGDTYTAIMEPNADAPRSLVHGAFHLDVYVRATGELIARLYTPREYVVWRMGCEAK